jgi:hypothetical protein
MEEALSFVVNRVLQGTGRIIGMQLSLRLAMEELERASAMSREIVSVKQEKDSVSIRLSKGTSDKKCEQVLETIIDCLIRSYSGVIGLVARTIVRDALRSADEKYGSKHQCLKAALKRMDDKAIS